MITVNPLLNGKYSGVAGCYLLRLRERKVGTETTVHKFSFTAQYN